MSETRKITLQFPSLRAFLAQYGERISAEGMLLRGEAPPAAGTKVDIEVVVAAGMRLLRARGETLWSGAAGGRQQAAAVRFQDLDEASRKLIDKIVEQRRREGAAPFRLADVPGPREARLLDLTMPAAAVAAEPAPPAAASPDGIFDLGEAPAAPAADLFDTGASARAEPAARERKPKAPVPLLADPEPADPFDLGPPPPGLEREEGLEAAASRLDPPREEPADSVDADLNSLFGRDEPRQAVPARTEAFPPSFVDEVEAELRAAEEPESSFLDVDTSELELQLGAPVTEPEMASEQPGETVPARPIEPAVETAGELELDPEIEIELELEDEPSVALDPAPTSAIELEPEPAPAPAIEPEPEPAPAPAAAPDLAPGADLAKRVAEAFEAAQGPETVEIPILASPPVPPTSPVPEPLPPAADPVPLPPAASPSPEPSPPVAGGTPPLTDLPPVSPPAAAPPPPTIEPPAVPPRPPAAPASRPVAPLDDNLLSLPELKSDKTPVEPAPPPPVELPSSAETLRGAARSSRHMGIWLLIALLAGALAVAGYLLWGLSRDDGMPLLPAGRPGATATEPAPTAAEPAPPAAEVGADTSGEDAAPSAPGAAAESPPGIEPEAVPEPPDAQPESPPGAAGAADAPQPAAPLTGLDRITWSETGEETVLSLVADGSIERRGVELDTISGAQPRLVLKIAGVQRAFQPAVLEVGTAQVDRVRTGLHPGNELHVVVDLAAEGVQVRDLQVGGGRVEIRLRSATE